MNEIGRRVTLAIVKYQEAGAKLANYVRMYRDDPKEVFDGSTSPSTINYWSEQSAIEYATARRLMGVE